MYQCRSRSAFFTTLPRWLRVKPRSPQPQAVCTGWFTRCINRSPSRHRYTLLSLASGCCCLKLFPLFSVSQRNLSLTLNPHWTARSSFLTRLPPPYWIYFIFCRRTCGHGVSCPAWPNGHYSRRDSLLLYRRHGSGIWERLRGWKGAIAGSFITGILIGIGPALIYPIMESVGLSGTSFPETDFVALGLVVYYIGKMLP